MRPSLQAGLLFVVVLALRLPFLHQAVQGDDPYYLKGAEHALVDPLHPNHARYVFQGNLVDMRGHPHPPLNSYVLAGLLAIFGEVREVPFHAAYSVFSLMAVFSVFSIARRFTTRPLAAALLFAVTPAFVINGNSFEADLPFVAFWLCAIALFLGERYVWAAAAACLAALAAYQGIVLTPVLAFLLWRRRAEIRPAAWMAILAAPATVGAYQIFERITSGALPAQMLAGYMSTYSLQTATAKLRNAVALTAHTGWLVFPALAIAAFRANWIAGVVAGIAAAVYDPNPLFWISVAAGAMVIAGCIRERRDPLPAWILVFFGAALVLFFAGSARYLLPIAAPVAILVAERLPGRWLAVGGGLSAIVSVGLAIVNYQHQSAYRAIAYQAPRVFTNAEWGLRYYLELQGARALVKEQALWPGDAVITTPYAAPFESGVRATVVDREIQSVIPLRIVGLGSKSGYSSVVWGLRPFDISTVPLDRVRIEVVAERTATESWLAIGTTQAAAQIISGIYNHDRWTGARAIVLLKRPPGATKVEAVYYVSPLAPARRVELISGGRVLAVDEFKEPGVRRISAPAPEGDPATVMLVVDRTFSAPPDARQLGVLLTEIGFK